MRPELLFSRGHAADLWSELMLLGPLSVPLLGALLATLPSGKMVRTPRGVFLLAATAAFFAPLPLIGAGNLGAARNWDLFSAPSVAPTLAGLFLICRFVEGPRARRLLGALLVLSCFHTLPWLALNTDVHRAAARVATLPLGEGRSEATLGTYLLNA